MPLSPAQYTERRDTLAKLLTETADALRSVSDEAHHVEPGLIQGLIAKLRAIRNKVFEDQFKLVLVARFQGGKSTTFNALAMGGRVISPMGDGAIKCSASLISNRNCEDASKRGVTLKWRTTEELARLCEIVLTSGTIDLSSFDGRSKAREAYRAEFELYQANRQSYPPTKLELLPIVDLITRFVGHTELAAMQKRLVSSPPSVEEVAELVRFPQGFATRWPDQAADFTLKEVSFVFLQSANLATDAPNLKQLGLEVVDCPGLFASEYDTSIATTMISSADAVWYLMDGKPAGEADLKALTLCRKLAPKALFVSVNLKADINPTRKFITTKIIPHIQTQLQQVGLTVELQPYHALLALLAQTGETLWRGESDPGAAAFMHQLVDDWSLETTQPGAAGVWAALCDHLLDRLKSGVQEFRSAGGQLNAQTLAIVGRESCLTSILGQLEQFVVQARAQAILIQRGVDQAILAVKDGVESPLAALEASANQDEKTARTNYNKAEKALRLFETQAEEQLAFIKGDENVGYDKDLAGEFFDEAILAAIPEVARCAAADIVKQVSFIDNLKGLIFKKTLGQKIESIIKGHFKSITEPNAAKWVKELGPNNSAAVAKMLKMAQRITGTLQRDWQGAVEGNQALGHLGAPVLPSAAFDVTDLAELLGIASVSNMAGGVSNMALITGGGGAAVFYLLTLIPGYGIAIATIGGIVITIINSVSLDKEDYKKKTEETIKDKLSLQLKAKRSEIIDGLITPLDTAGTSLGTVRENIVAALEDPIKSSRVRFDAQRKNAMAILEDRKVDRAVVAADCRRLREGRVVPMRQRLKAYRNETQPLC